ncbi:unnamed protein product, partial [Discosporangium mesarthrocarpum]
QVACSYFHTVVVTDSDQVFAFGRNDFGQLGMGDKHDRLQPTPIERFQGKSITAVACGQYHTVHAGARGGGLGLG